MEAELERVKNAPESEWRDVEVPDERIIAAMIDTVLTALIASPIATTDAELELEDISEILKGLPNRQGLAKIEGNIYEIQTIDLPHTINKDEITKRWNTIEKQTKKYSRGRREIETEIEKIYATPLLNKVDDSQQRSDRLDRYESLDDF